MYGKGRPVGRRKSGSTTKLCCPSPVPHSSRNTARHIRDRDRTRIGTGGRAACRCRLPIPPRRSRLLIFPQISLRTLPSVSRNDVPDLPPSRLDSCPHTINAVHMLIFGYVRVSTDRQAEQGVSIEAQEAKIRLGLVPLRLGLFCPCGRGAFRQHEGRPSVFSDSLPGRRAQPVSLAHRTGAAPARERCLKPVPGSPFGEEDCGGPGISFGPPR